MICFCEKCKNILCYFFDEYCVNYLISINFLNVDVKYTIKFTWIVCVYTRNASLHQRRLLRKCCFWDIVRVRSSPREGFSHLFSLLLKEEVREEKFKREVEGNSSFFRTCRALRTLVCDNIRCQCKHEGVENSQVKFPTSQRQEWKHSAAEKHPEKQWENTRERRVKWFETRCVLIRTSPPCKNT